MIHIKYEDKQGNPVHRVELTKGEQYDLMKRNRAALEENDELSAADWRQIFNDTVRFA